MDIKTAAVKLVDNYPQEVWLFGSCARGDPSDTSDIDVLVVSAFAPNKDDLGDWLPAEYPSNAVSISHYTETGLKRLIEAGSLFAWHLKLEGKCLFSMHGLLARRLRDIAPYSSYRADIGILRAMVEDVRESLAHDRYTIELEASILGVALRNAAMILSYRVGSPVFSANAILEMAAHPLVAPIIRRLGKSVIQGFIDARLTSERGVANGVRWDPKEVDYASKVITAWLDRLCQCDLIRGGEHATSISTSLAS